MPVAPDPKVNILLSVHNGAPYLDELIESIRSQSYEQWSLLVADDGSGDDSTEVIARHAFVDDRIRIVTTRPQAIGSARSFMELLGHVEPDAAFAFCDQDDVWFPQKLKWSIDALVRLTATHRIAAVATDAIVTDSSLQMIAPSALDRHGVKRDVTLGRLFVNNVAIGATLVGTADLAHAAHSTGSHEDVRMHDWWCVLIAAYAGAFEVLAVPTMQWRRHDRTVTGVRPDTLSARVDRRLSTMLWGRQAARWLIANLEPVSETAASTAASMAEMSGDSPTPMELIRLRRNGIRAWSARHDANVLGAAMLRRGVERLRRP